MSNELKHADVIVHMAKHGYSSVEFMAQGVDYWCGGACADCNPITHPQAEWRIKPATITYTVTVPEPLRVMPNNGDVYWFCATTGFECTTFSSRHNGDMGRFHAGNCWDTEAKAQAAFDALFGPLRVVK